MSEIKITRAKGGTEEQEVPIKEIEIKKVHLADDTAYANAWLVLESDTPPHTRIFWGRTPSAAGSIAEVSTPRRSPGKRRVSRDTT